VEHGRTGLLCDPHDWRTLGDNVIAVLRNADLASQLARNARRQAEAYRWGNVRHQWLSVYQSLVSGDKEFRAEESTLLRPKSVTAEAE
jgi:glycosyltransferase involved in cell wall biosynthesis